MLRPAMKLIGWQAVDLLNLSQTC